MKILIPTCKQLGQLAPLLKELEAIRETSEIYLSCLPESAAVNRNYILSHVRDGEIAIMIDDDISGFYPGWTDDLAEPLRDESVVMVSARLLDPDGTFGPTCSRCYDPTPDEIEVFSNGECVMPTAAIAFRHRGHMFDEQFIGSGFEDSDWMHQYLAADPGCRFIQSNKCRLIHRNEMKNQKGQYWKHNQAVFYNKWHPLRVKQTIFAGMNDRP